MRQKDLRTYFYQQQQMDEYYPAYVFDLNDSIVPEMIICNWHREAEFVMVQEGTLLLYIDEVLYEMHEGDICIINPHQLHYGLPQGSPCEAIVMLFNPKDLLVEGSHNEPHLSALADGLSWFPPQVRQTDPIYPDVRDLLLRLREVFKGHKPAFELQLKSLLLELVYLFASHENTLVNDSGWDSSKSKEKLLQLNEWLDQHFAERFTIREMAEQLFMSQESLYKLMTSTMGCSPISYLMRYRLNRAADLLYTTSLSVTDVCFQTGFQNISYFIRAFKKQYGCTPGQYVRRSEAG